MTKALTKQKTDLVTVEEAIGKIRVLAVGVSNQKKDSNFVPLRQCSYDAAAVKSRFANTWQLFGHPDHLRQLPEAAGDKPTKSEIISALRQLATAAGPDDRILFYFSGHGHRIGDKLYLVPEDAWTDDDPEALLAFDKILEYLSASQAKHKIIVLDACNSGPDLAHFKHSAAQFSEGFLAEYIKKSAGIVVLASSLSEQASSTKSPNPQLSLFTHFFVKALDGEADALDNGLLTIEKLYEYVSVQVARVSKSHHRPQQPALHLAKAGMVVLGDFRRMLNPAELKVDDYPIRDVAFEDTARMKVKEVLTKIQNWKYSTDYLVDKVNNNLGVHFEQEIGRLVAKLRNEMGFDGDSIEADGAAISFPDGRFWMEYSATDQKSGVLTKHVAFEVAGWAGRYDDVIRIVEIFGMYPTRVSMSLTTKVKPLELVAGLQQREWVLSSQLRHQIQAKAKTGHTVTIETDSITFDGFSPSELLGSNADPEKAALVARTLLLLSSGK